MLYTDYALVAGALRELGLPSGETCRRRLEEWSRRGLFQQAIRVLQEQLAGRTSWTGHGDRRRLNGGRKKGATRSPAPLAARLGAATTSP